MTQQHVPVKVLKVEELELELELVVQVQRSLIRRRTCRISRRDCFLYRRMGRQCRELGLVANSQMEWIIFVHKPYRTLRRHCFPWRILGN